MTSHSTPDAKGAFSELSSVRVHSHHLLQLAYQNKLEFFHYDPSKLVTVLHTILSTITEDERLLTLPYQNCWRYLESPLNPQNHQISSDFLERGRALFDLALLAIWFDIPHPADQKGEKFSLNVISRLWRAGTFSSNSEKPLQVDSKKLQELSYSSIASYFSGNLVEELLKNRISFLSRAGHQMSAFPDEFGNPRRFGNWFDHLLSQSHNQKISIVILYNFLRDWWYPVWGDPTRQGLPQGDYGTCASVQDQAETPSIINFSEHIQLSCYALAELLEQFGLQVTELDLLTGIPDAVTSHFLLDSEWISFKKPILQNQTHHFDSDLVVELRALTVGLLDVLSDELSFLLNIRKYQLPLNRMVQRGILSMTTKGHAPLKIDRSRTL